MRMRKRLWTILCVVALVLGMLALPACSKSASPNKAAEPAQTAESEQEQATTDDAAISEVEREVLHRAGAGFRTGMGGMEATCGALCGAVMVAGLKLPDTVVAGKVAKQMHERFVEISGASICKILKSRRPDGRFVCDCDDCVRHGVRVFGEIL